MKPAASRPHVSAAEILLGRFDGVQRYGAGWRAKCPSCGGASRKVSIAEGDDGRVLLHCFGGCDSQSVVQAVGLAVSDLFPTRPSEDTPASRRRMRRVAREAHWGAALDMLDAEVRVILFAARVLRTGSALNAEDAKRLALAATRVSDARSVLRDIPKYTPARATQ